MHQKIRRMISAGGDAIALAGCGAGASNVGASNASAPGAAAPGVAPANNGQVPYGLAVSGKVGAVNGDTFTVQDPRQQGTVTVKMTGSTQVLRQTSIALSSIPTGQAISAFGTQDGNVFTATQVTAGTTANGPGGISQPGRTSPAGGPNNGQQQNGPPPSNGTPQPGRSPGDRLTGTVEQAAGDTLTVKTTNGSRVQMQLAAGGQVTQQVAGTPADITAGVQVMVVAVGQQSGTSVTAARVVVIGVAQSQ